MALIVLRARAGAAGSARCVGCVVRESWADAGAALRCARGTDALRDGDGWSLLRCARLVSLVGLRCALLGCETRDAGACAHGMVRFPAGWFAAGVLQAAGEENKFWKIRDFVNSE